MAKLLITERRLVEAINLALRHDWPHKDCHCEVVSLRKVNYPERNWEVDSTTRGGVTLLHEAECQRFLDRVLNESVGKYDVDWSTE